MAADEEGIVEESNSSRPIRASEEEIVIDWIVLGFGAEWQRMVTVKAWIRDDLETLPRWHGADVMNSVTSGSV